MILSFRDRAVETLIKEGTTRRFGSSSKAARRKLFMLNSADVLDDLRYPPGNHLEALKGKERVNTASESTISTGFVSSGRQRVLPT